MMHTQDLSPSAEARDNRSHNMQPFTLLKISRASVVDQIRSDDGQASDLVFASGLLRELCPYCLANHLNLVLRQKHVRYAHLFCDCCHTCFDARYPDGSSALALDE